MKANFVQIYRTDERAPSREEAGILYLKKPGKMRWEYTRPEVKLFLSDGKRIFFYVPQDNQVIRIPVKRSADLRTPLGLLLGRMNLKRAFRVELASDAAPLDPGNPVLRLRPKKNRERFRELLLEVDGRKRIRRIKILETDGTITEFRLFGEIPNPAPGQRPVPVSSSPRGRADRGIPDTLAQIPQPRYPSPHTPARLLGHLTSLRFRGS